MKYDFHAFFSYTNNPIPITNWVRQLSLLKIHEFIDGASYLRKCNQIEVCQAEESTHNWVRMEEKACFDVLLLQKERDFEGLKGFLHTSSTTTRVSGRKRKKKKLAWVPTLYYYVRIQYGYYIYKHWSAPLHLEQRLLYYLAVMNLLLSCVYLRTCAKADTLVQVQVSKM